MLLVPIGDKWIIGVKVREASVAFFKPLFSDASHVPNVDVSNHFLSVPVMKYAVTSGRWKKIGKCDDRVLHNIPVPRYYILDAATKKDWAIYANGTVNPATREECVGLECMAAWDPDHLEKRIAENLKGRRSKWDKDTPLE